MKIAVTPEYQDEKNKTLSLRQVTFDFVAKIINCFKWYMFYFWRLCSGLVRPKQPFWKNKGRLNWAFKANWELEATNVVFTMVFASQNNTVFVLSTCLIEWAFVFKRVQ